MNKALVTVGTDGQTDWVRLSNGTKMSLGSISVLSFIAKLTATTNEAKKALNGFLGGQEVLITVDENRMWDLLAPKRSRWSSSNSSFMPPDQRTPSRITTMIDKTALLKLTQHIEDLTKYASKASPEKMAEGVAILHKLASKVTAADASEEEDDDKEEPEEEQAKEASVKLAYDTVVENKALVTDILAKAEATVETIDKLASAGRKFNASRAKADLHAVTSKVAGILRTAELTEKWVNPDLQILSKQVDHIHGLFASAK